MVKSYGTPIFMVNTAPWLFGQTGLTSVDSDQGTQFTTEFRSIWGGKMGLFNLKDKYGKELRFQYLGCLKIL